MYRFLALVSVALLCAANHSPARNKAAPAAEI